MLVVGAVEAMFSEVSWKIDEVSGGARGGACGVVVRGARRARRGSVAMIDEECQRQLIRARLCTGVEAAVR